MSDERRAGRSKPVGRLHRTKQLDSLATSYFSAAEIHEANNPQLGRCKACLCDEFGDVKGQVLYELWVSLHMLAEELVGYFGFQTKEGNGVSDGEPELSSVENQIENVHDLICNAFARSVQESANPYRRLSVQPGAETPESAALREMRLGAIETIRALYRRQFEGFHDWCIHLQLSCNYQEILDSMELDKDQINASCYTALQHLLLYYLIWGEAANLRHLPECLSFIFWSALDHLVPQEEGGIAKYGRFDYLDSIVRPIYHLIQSETNKLKPGRLLSEEPATGGWGCCTKQLDLYEKQNGSRVELGGDNKISSTLTYDDLNEFFWDRTLLRELVCDDNQDRLPKEVPKSRDGTSAYQQLRQRLTCTTPELKNVFLAGGKTYRERRSWFHVYYSFHRVVILHLFTFHIIMVAAFSGWGWKYLTTASLTHAALRAAHALISFFMSPARLRDRSRNPRRTPQHHRSSLLPTVVTTVPALFLLVLLVVDTNPGILEEDGDERNLDVFKWFGLGHIIYYFVKFFFITRPGYVVRTKLKVCNGFPFITIVREKGDFPLDGQNMAVPVPQFVVYALFWLCVWATKVSFSYFLVAEPLVDPTRLLLDRSWLNSGGADGDWILVLVRWSSPFLMFLGDTVIWFQMYWMLVGIIRGSSVGLKVGEVKEWPDLVRRFDEVPERLEKYVLHKSAKPEDSTTFQPRSAPINARWLWAEACSTTWKNYAVIWNKILQSLRRDDLLSNAELITLSFVVLESGDLMCPGANTDDAEEPFFSHQDLVIYPPMLASPILRVSTVDNYQPRSHNIFHGVEGERILSQARDLLIWIFFKLGLLRAEYRGAVARNVVYLFSELAKELQAESSNVNQPLVEVVALLQSLRETVRLFMHKLHYVVNVMINEERPDWAKSAGVDKHIKEIRRVLEQLREYTGVQPEYSVEQVLGHSGDGETDPQDLTSLTCSDLYQRLEGTMPSAASQDGSRLSPAQLITHSLLNWLAPSSKGAPESKEAKRILTFFMNSIFSPTLEASGTAKGVPSTMDMRSWTVFTPHYTEDCMLSIYKLSSNTEEHVDTLDFLRTAYKYEWRNLQERIGYVNSPDALHDTDIEDYLSKTGEFAPFNSKKSKELSLWASKRLQVLSRTVHGMMKYREAIEILAAIEGFGEKAKSIASRKFRYVVTSQVYGDLKASDTLDKRWIAESIDLLLRDYPEGLVIAYVDQKSDESNNKHYYSCAMTGTSSPTSASRFRVRLPGAPILGEGKPENQNQAVIFTRGQYLQVIDMNQDNYLSEAFKARNLLETFKSDVRIVGFREHIFSNSSGAVGEFAAATEYTFGTIVQRVFSVPLHVRFHYGHPDFFDKTWTMSRGGLSKAVKTCHISEDIFGGFNVVARGGKVHYEESIQCGKGRDMAFMAINGFEQKIAGGNAFQAISRDVHRLSKQFDLFRLLSFYHGGVGYKLSNALITWAAYAFIFSQCILALTDSENIGDNEAGVYTAEYIFQLGLLGSLPFIAEKTIEEGIFRALWAFVKMFCSGSLLFFIFVSRTKAFYFHRGLILGGASYVATGRELGIRNERFHKLYSLYANSHIYFGMELMALLVLFGLYSINVNDRTWGSYFLTTWAVWLMGIALVFAPWWFNPLSFNIAKQRTNFREWRAWLFHPDPYGFGRSKMVPLIEEDGKLRHEETVDDVAKRRFVDRQYLSSLKPWESWEAMHHQRTRAIQEAPLVGRFLLLLQTTPRIVLIISSISAFRTETIGYSLGIFFGQLGLLVVGLLCIYFLNRKTKADYLPRGKVDRVLSGRLTRKYRYWTWGILAAVTVASVGLAVGLSLADENTVYNLLTSLLACSLLLDVVIQFWFFLQSPRHVLHHESVPTFWYRKQDVTLGLFIFSVLFILSALSFGLLDRFQSRFLFNRAFEKHIRNERLDQKAQDQVTKSHARVASPSVQSPQT
mmetsp:Transcript_2084/g.7452  ORF Transcript_2084/g.7452 Transcript_2084/m.7452 type:complete len:1929 (-) Transcript_2084:164-5950(-)